MPELKMGLEDHSHFNIMSDDNKRRLNKILEALDGLDAYDIEYLLKECKNAVSLSKFRYEP